MNDATLPRLQPGTVSRRALFFGFLRIGLAGFGGTLPHARHQMVESRGWLNDQEFADMLSAGQLLPGPNIANIAVMFGARQQGLWGALAALIGLVLVPMIIILVLAALYRESGDQPWVRGAFAGVSAAAAGLVLAIGVKLAQAQPRRLWIGLVAAAAFAAIALARLPLLPVILLLAPVGVLCAWRWRS